MLKEGQSPLDKKTKDITSQNQTNFTIIVYKAEQKFKIRYIKNHGTAKNRTQQQQDDYYSQEQQHCSGTEQPQMTCSMW